METGCDQSSSHWQSQTPSSSDSKGKDGEVPRLQKSLTSLQGLCGLSGIGAAWQTPAPARQIPEIHEVLSAKLNSLIR